VRKLGGMLGAGPPFRDRRDAGKKLARPLARYREEHPVVFALPRGGVPVAYEVALALEAPLDVLVARKLGAPDQPEFGIGAVAPAGCASSTSTPSGASASRPSTSTGSRPRRPPRWGGA
jgi:predicted phosphoribosyltransferase